VLRSTLWFRDVFEDHAQSRGWRAPSAAMRSKVGKVPNQSGSTSQWRRCPVTEVGSGETCRNGEQPQSASTPEARRRYSPGRESRKAARRARWSADRPLSAVPRPGNERYRPWLDRSRPRHPTARVSGCPTLNNPLLKQTDGALGGGPRLHVSARSGQLLLHGGGLRAGQPRGPVSGQSSEISSLCLPAIHGKRLDHVGRGRPASPS